MINIEARRNREIREIAEAASIEAEYQRRQAIREANLSKQQENNTNSSHTVERTSTGTLSVTNGHARSPSFLSNHSIGTSFARINSNLLLSSHRSFAGS